MMSDRITFGNYELLEENKGEQFIHPDDDFKTSDYRHIDIMCNIWFLQLTEMTTLLSKVKEWLKEEVKEHQDCADAYENGKDPIVSDNTDEICVGRHEVAESLLNMIGQWEKEMDALKIAQYVDWTFQDPDDEIDWGEKYS